MPRFTKVVPSPLVCIVALTALSMILKLDLRTVGDMGQLPSSLPVFLIPDIPFNFQTLLIILPYSLPLAIVGLLESLMTATIVDDFTDTESDKSRECTGQGIANIVYGFFGGMAGCAMIGQSVINVKSGGRGRLSSFCAGVFLLILIVVLGQWVKQIPMAALVAVMIMVSIGTFNWASFKNLRVYPKSSSMVMIATVLVVVGTHNLALGVGVGVLLSALVFARKVSQLLDITTELSPDGSERTYRVRGQLFFVSANTFSSAFDFREVVKKVRIDVSPAHFWDLTSVNAIDKVVIKYRREGTEVELIGLNEAGRTIVDRLAVHHKPGAMDQAPAH